MTVLGKTFVKIGSGRYKEGYEPSLKTVMREI